MSRRFALIDPPPQQASRRGFVIGSSLALAGLAIGCTRRTEAAVAATPDGAPRIVTIVAFDDAGHRLRAEQLPMVVKSDAAWQRQLSPLAYRVTRKGATERAYSGALLALDEPGVYRCICCDTALYDAATKFHSGTGWPSFWQPIARENVTEHSDRTFGMVRTEVRCTRCDAHLGHVFDDGPRPTGLRYCMNSVALRFAPAAG